MKTTKEKPPAIGTGPVHPESLRGVPLGDLLSGITDRVKLLVVGEVALAKAEIRSDVKSEIAMVRGLGIAAVCALLGLRCRSGSPPSSRSPRSFPDGRPPSWWVLPSRPGDRGGSDRVGLARSETARSQQGQLEGGPRMDEEPTGVGPGARRCEGRGDACRSGQPPADRDRRDARRAGHVHLELDRRRHEALDLKLQAKRHPALALGAGVAILGAVAGGLAMAIRARRHEQPAGSCDGRRGEAPLPRPPRARIREQATEPRSGRR